MGFVSKRKLIASRLAKRPPPTDVQNHLLAALPEDDWARLAPSLKVVPLTLMAMLHTPGTPLREVYFPGGGFCSLVTVLSDSRMIEVATVGREGMVGVTALSVGSSPIAATIVQGETDVCYEMSVEAFRSEMHRGSAFRDVVTRYIDAHIGVIMQFTACNAVHSVEQRLARWLLLAHDRMDADAFPLTQEFAAMMLGAARPTVTLTAGALQRAGLITYRRGLVTVLDRARLEGAACECYRASVTLLNAVITTNSSPRRSRQPQKATPTRR